jgi:MYXO-CTERM domain-containing protein
MVGRFTIEVTGDSATNNQVTLQFAVAGKNNGTTTFTGATQAAGRFNYTLTYASVPAPGAAALVGLAGVLSRRRRAA